MLQSLLMEKDRSVPRGLVCLLGAIFLVVAATCVLLPAPAYSDHKLKEENCYDCHAVGGAKDIVVQNTRLLKKDAKILELINAGWTPGPEVPCVFCHDDDTIRTNRMGVKNHFSTYSISSHMDPVDAMVSNNQGSTFVLDCIECHTDVVYIGQVAGAGTSSGNPLNPNIHGLDTSAVTWTGAGLLDVSDTFKADGNTVFSPYNADGNTLCRTCHDPNYYYSLYSGASAGHGFTDTGSLTMADISVQDKDGFTSSVPGCLNRPRKGISA